MISFILVLFFFFMLFFPDVIFQGAATGLLLWFQTVLPTLFPFFIINALLLKSGTIYHFSKILSPLFRPFLRISDWSSYAVLGGFFCGTPIGAKIIVDLVSEKRISHEEGEYLLSFCNNTSPGFVIGFLFGQTYSLPGLAYPSLLILCASAILSGHLFRKIYYPDLVLSPQTFTRTPSGSSLFAGLDLSIGESLETLLKIGGYIMIFCVLTSALQLVPIPFFFWTSLVLPFLELTNGVRMIASQNLSLSTAYVLLMALSSFGGLCAAFQTKCMIQKTGFSFSCYIKEKLITTMVTSLLSFLFIQFYCHYSIR